MRATPRKLTGVVVGATVATVALAACGKGGGSGSASGEDYTKENIEVVVPFSAGGPADTVTRIVADPLGSKLGRQIVVQNVEGAGGTIGAGDVAKAKPDGYTLLLHHIGMATAPSLYKNLAYKPQEDFAPIGIVAEVPMTIVSRKDLGPKDMAGLKKYVQDNKAKVTYAHAGVGSASQLCGLLIKKAFGVDFQEVPYKGAAPAIADVIGGQVDFICDQTTNTTVQITSGKVTAYAATSAERLKALPEVPTAKEAGYPDIEVTAWQGLYAPAKTPDAVVDKLEKTLQESLADPSVASQLEKLGATVPTAKDQTSEGLADRLKQQTALWGDVITEPAK